MLKAPRLIEGQHNIGGTTLYHSGFNTQWFTELQITPKVVADVGAFDFGDAVRIKLLYPECEVYSFELDKRNYNKYNQHAQSVGVITHLCAVSDNDTVINGYYESHHDQGVNAQSTLVAPTDIYKSNYPYVKHKYIESNVTQIRLDTFFGTQQIDLLHLDVEGAEYKVLLGLGKLRPTLIWLEYLIDGAWEGCSFERVDNLLLSYNYKLVLHDGFDKLWRYNG